MDEKKGRQQKERSKVKPASPTSLMPPPTAMPSSPSSPPKQASSKPNKIPLSPNKPDKHSQPMVTNAIDTGYTIVPLSPNKPDDIRPKQLQPMVTNATDTGYTIVSEITELSENEYERICNHNGLYVGLGRKALVSSIKLTSDTNLDRSILEQPLSMQANQLIRQLTTASNATLLLHKYQPNGPVDESSALSKFINTLRDEEQLLIKLVLSLDEKTRNAVITNLLKFLIHYLLLPSSINDKTSERLAYFSISIISDPTSVLDCKVVNFIYLQAVTVFILANVRLGNDIDAKWRTAFTDLIEPKDRKPNEPGMRKDGGFYDSNGQRSFDAVAPLLQTENNFLNVLFLNEINLPKLNI
nr:hypothetical protein [Apis mellifera nudivirus]